MRTKTIFFFLITTAIISCKEVVTQTTLHSLIATTTELPGSNCANGGLRIESGVDHNGNEILDETEITDTSYLCAAEPLDAQNSLVSITDEPVGTNCANGGLKVESGLDNDGDGVLDQAEITTTSYLCTPDALNAQNSLIDISNEPSGTNCENGGIKIDTGLDANDNGLLDNEEVAITSIYMQWFKWGI